MNKDNHYFFNNSKILFVKFYNYILYIQWNFQMPIISAKINLSYCITNSKIKYFT